MIPNSDRSNSTLQLRLAVGAILKDEFPYILEWIAYHRVIGFNRFFIADNESRDGTGPLLRSLAELGIVNCIPFPSPPGKAPQLPAYKEILKLHGKDADWIAFIDADEFILPTSGDMSFRSFVADIAKDPLIGGIVLNWATYGSSGIAKASQEPVIERFTKRGEKDWVVNCHYKTVARIAANPTVRGSPHLFGVKTGFRVVQTNGETLVDHPQRGEGLSAEVVWTNARLNHYVVKSREEFFDRKGPKGRVSVVGGTKGEGYFTTHDQNQVSDPIPRKLVEATKLEMFRLKRLVDAARAQRGEEPLSELRRAPVPKEMVAQPIGMYSRNDAIPINVARCHVGNHMFRYMAAKCVARAVPGATLTGYHMPEWGLTADDARPSMERPLVLKPQHHVDVQGIAFKLRAGVNDGVDFHAYGQRVEYFLEDREKFALEFSSSEEGARTYSDEIVCHVRSGDILEGLHADYVPVPISYYKDLVMNMGLRPVFVGQIEDNWYTKALRNEFPRARFLKGNNWLEDFQTVRNAKNTVVAASTFSWLAAWLSGEKANIFMPLLGILNSKQRPDIDLIPVNDSRYTLHEFPIVKYNASKEHKEYILLEDWRNKPKSSEVAKAQ